MHVDEKGTSFVNQSSIVKIDVVNETGSVFTMEFSHETTIEAIKCAALAHFNRDQLAAGKMSQQFKLVSIEQKKPLLDALTVRDANLSNDDTLLLLQKIQGSKGALGGDQEEIGMPKEMKNRGPNESQIAEATTTLVPKNVNKKINQVAQLDFMCELRKILISLVDFSEKLLRNHPDVYPIFKDINNYMEKPKQVEDVVDQEALQQLVDMGFPREKAKRALKLNGMSAIDAMDWLLAYESTSSTSSSSLAVGIPAPIPSSSNARNASFSLPNMDGRGAGQTSALERAVESHIGICPRVPAIVECYRNFKRKQFRANQKALKGLKEMGFTDEEALDALWINQNNEVQACEYLLSDRRPKYEDLQRGLSKDNPIFKALINSPLVQVGLIKPKIFFAFLQLIEEPNNTSKFFSDPETSPILSQIFRIYHSEKHAAYGDVLRDEENAESTTATSTPQAHQQAASGNTPSPGSNFHMTDPLSEPSVN